MRTNISSLVTDLLDHFPELLGYRVLIDLTLPINQQVSTVDQEIPLQWKDKNKLKNKDPVLTFKIYLIKSQGGKKNLKQDA